MRGGWMWLLLLGAYGHAAWGLTMRALDDARILRAEVPMPAPAARALVQRAARAGLPPAGRAPLEDYLRTAHQGNSVPLALHTAARPLCLAMGLRMDVEAVLAFAPAPDAGTRAAVSASLLTHEAVHCASIVLPLSAAHPRHPSYSEDELEGLALLREEALADELMYQSLLFWGRAGYHASLAWQRYRIFGLLRGDLDHWTTPLLLGGFDAVTDDDYQGLGRAWRALARAINLHPDGSDAQAQAWQAAVAQVPPPLRVGLPTLATIRTLALQRWPQAPDWRCAAGLRRGAWAALPPACASP